MTISATLAAMLLASAQPAPRRPPTPPSAGTPLASYFSTDDYPAEALRARRRARLVSA